MASHAFLRFLLKTPEGYLTPTGIAKDINDKSIIVLNILEIGGVHSTKETQIANFLKRTSANLGFLPEEYKVVYYSCSHDKYYSCADCPLRKKCMFWNKRDSCWID